MKRFVKKNGILVVFFLASILVIFLYMVTMDVPELFYNGEQWFSLLLQVAIGYIINFIFYIMQVYLPRLKYEKTAVECMISRIETVCLRMDEIFIHLGKRVPYEEGSDDYFIEMLRNFEYNRKISVVDIRKDFLVKSDNCYFSEKEWILTRVELIENEIDKIFRYYSQFVTPELMDVLEKIMKSQMHWNFARIFLQNPNGVSFKECSEDVFFSQYYKFKEDLKEITKKIRD